MNTTPRDRSGERLRTPRVRSRKLARAWPLALWAAATLLGAASPATTFAQGVTLSPMVREGRTWSSAGFEIQLKSLADVPFEGLATHANWENWVYVDPADVLVGVSHAQADAVARPGLPYPYVSAQTLATATGEAPLSSGSFASAKITYSMAVLGPTADGTTEPASVDLLVSATGEARATSGSAALSSLVVIGPQVYIVDMVNINPDMNVAETLGNGVATPNNGHIVENQVFSFQLNTEYFVTLGVSVSSGSGAGLADSSAFASMDPYFSFASTVSHPELYRIVLSEGVVNAPVPEPSTPALLLGGLALLVGALRPRRKPAVRF